MIMKINLSEDAIQYGIHASIESKGSRYDPSGYKRFLAECKAARAMIPNPSYSRAEWSIGDCDDEGYVQILTLYFELGLDSPSEGYPYINILGKYDVNICNEDDGEGDAEMWAAIKDAAFTKGL